MKRLLPVIIPALLWCVSAIPLVAPSIFDLNRMSHIVAISCLGVLSLPMQLLVVAFTYPHNWIILICLLVLIMPIGPFLISPIISRSGYDWKSWIYIVLLFFFVLIGAILVNFRIDALGKAYIYGYKYPDHRYLEFRDFTRLTEVDSNVVIFTQIDSSPRSGYTVSIRNGALLPIDTGEMNQEWALRNMQEAPHEGYIDSIEWFPRLSRRPSQTFFYCKVDGRFGKGVIGGGQQAEIFVLNNDSNIFSSIRTDTSVFDWLSWFTGQDNPIYIK